MPYASLQNTLSDQMAVPRAHTGDRPLVLLCIFLRRGDSRVGIRTIFLGWSSPRTAGSRCNGARAWLLIVAALDTDTYFVAHPNLRPRLVFFPLPPFSPFTPLLLPIDNPSFSSSLFLFNYTGLALLRSWLRIAGCVQIGFLASPLHRHATTCREVLWLKLTAPTTRRTGPGKLSANQAYTVLRLLKARAQLNRLPWLTKSHRAWLATRTHTWT